jgi:hypothetical protein
MALLTIGVSIADETPSYVAYIQGGETSITDGTDEIIELTVKDIVPNLYVSEKDYGILVPIDILNTLTYPVSAVLLFSSTEDESTSLVEILNLSLIGENKDFTIKVKPLEFYEGERLKSFHSESTGLNTINLTTKSFTGIYIELKGNSIENGSDPECVRRCQERYPGRNGCWKQCISR